MHCCGVVAVTLLGVAVANSGVDLVVAVLIGAATR